MKLTHVYILKCSDNSYYTGMTNNLDRRLSEHIEGHDPFSYTFSRRPVELVFWQACYSPMEAIILEKKLKRWSRAKKQAFIEENWKRLVDLSECRNDTTHKNYSKD
jgi:putative endonuclease